jgi:hypothetical protein
VADLVDALSVLLLDEWGALEVFSVFGQSLGHTNN